MTEQTITPGSYLHDLIEQESRAVAKRHNSAGYIAMWPDPARKVMDNFPNLSAAERAALRGTVGSRIQALSVRTNMDIHQFGAAFDSVARLLGGASC